MAAPVMPALQKVKACDGRTHLFPIGNSFPQINHRTAMNPTNRLILYRKSRPSRRVPFYFLYGHAAAADGSRRILLGRKSSLFEILPICGDDML